MEEHTARPPEPESRARYKITLDAGCLRAELRNRGTTEDMETFLRTVAATCLVLDQGRVLISVDSSNPLSRLDRSVLFARLNEVWRSPSHKVAVLGDGAEFGVPHAYVKSFAVQHGVNVRSFDDEATALQWVRDRRLGRDRRFGQERRARQERRQTERRSLLHDRRLGPRRDGAEAHAPL